MNKPRARPNLRPDHNGTQRAQFESNKKRIYATQTICGICGKPVDFSLKWPHPLSPCVDHIVPDVPRRTGRRFCWKTSWQSGGGFGYLSVLEGADISLLEAVSLAHWLCANAKERKKQYISF